MANKLYKIIGGKAYDIMQYEKQHVVSGVATPFTEGAMSINSHTAYPITRFQIPPFLMYPSGSNMIARVLANDKTLTINPIVVGMGSSTMAGYGQVSPNRYWDHIASWFAANTVGSALYNIGVSGIDSKSMQLTSVGGAPGQNLDTAFTYNPSMIIWDEPTNWATSYDENQQIAYWEAAYNACLAKGVLIFFNSSRPRGSFNSSQQARLKSFNSLLLSHPFLRYVSNADGDKFWDTSTVYALKSIYDSGDQTHLNPAGLTILANDTTARILKTFRKTTAYISIEIHRSSDGISYSLFDTITDFSTDTKSYPFQDGYYKLRGKLKDNSFTSFSPVSQIVAQNPTANAGADKNLVTGTTTVNITGTGTAYAGATITAYAWSIIVGSATLVNANTSTVTVNGLTNGNSYTLRLTVTDSNGLTGSDDVVVNVAASAIARRLLFDLGGGGTSSPNGTGPGGGNATPTGLANIPIGIDPVTGYTWNNVVDMRAGTWSTNPQYINGVVATGMSITFDKKPGGTSTAAGDFSQNFLGINATVVDYPATAVVDNCYFANDAGLITATIVLPSGVTSATLKIFGNRDATGPRILQGRIHGQAIWQEFEAATTAGTINYITNSMTITGLVAGPNIVEFQTKPGSTYGHASVLDFNVTF